MPAPFIHVADIAAKLHGPVAVDAIGPATSQPDVWMRRDRERRRGCSWAHSDA
jgi:hypothetical protein